MAKIKNNNSFNNGAYPQPHYYGDSYSGCTHGLSKLEYTAIRIFCSQLPLYSPFKEYKSPEDELSDRRVKSIEQAKLLLQECEEESK